MLKLTKRTRKEKGSRRDLYYISGTYQGERIRESLGTDRREEAQRRFEKRRSEIVSALDAGRAEADCGACAPGRATLSDTIQTTEATRIPRLIE